jgi:carbonic anhydrase
MRLVGGCECSADRPNGWKRRGVQPALRYRLGDDEFRQNIQRETGIKPEWPA